VDSLYFIVFTPALVLLELIYFRIARAYNILDKPNSRSLHEKPTIRGGGIIFPLAVILFASLSGKVSLYFLAALALISIVGLWDDVRGLGQGVRFAVQVLCMIVIFYDLNFFIDPWWAVLLLLLGAVCTINTYNFMDGINGITGGYSLTVLATLYLVNTRVIPFVNGDLLIAMMLALAVFSFFNFRTRAICFAGDVGSLSIGFAMIYVIFKLIIASGNFIFVLFLAVYGVDSFLTIVHRLILRQNIFKPHRLHLYQIVVATTGMPHLAMTSIYIVVQTVVSAVVIVLLCGDLMLQYFFGAVILVLLALLYILLKRHFYKLLRDAV
jgi:UDP-N-acetylmuramyl pentapeptide phosphotransferase/UDP-N-acetylglucosamine-1-phosphate transferase